MIAYRWKYTSNGSFIVNDQVYSRAECREILTVALGRAC